LLTLVLVAQRGQPPPPTPPPGQGAQGTGAGRVAGAGGQRGAGRGGGPITIKAARVIDGRGNVVKDAIITVQGSKIVSIGLDPGPNPPTYDLGDATVLPGMMDVHVHLQWIFGPDGKYGNRGAAVVAGYQSEAILQNARDTLMAGFTTVQSVGWEGDKALRDAIAAGTVVGPRLLTSLQPVGGGTPDAIRESVRQRKAAGADLIKFFASGSIRDGGKMSTTQEQLDAVCGEAKLQGLRTLVHAHDSPSIIATVKAGCTEVEHGLFADDASIKAMADAHTYFDPNIGLVLQNYLENEDKYMGSGNFNEAGFASMESALPLLPAMFRKALTAGLKMPMGTDAVAGAHGQNAREIVARVAAGQKPMDAIIGATSLSAESMHLGDQIGTLQPGFEADLVAVNGDPLRDITRLQHVMFVMKGGKVYKK
jgi:imidazolonepropionase-like amidohydrolase